METDKPPSVRRAGEKEELASTDQPNRRAVFIIHGRNLEAKKQVGIFLRACGLTPVNFDDVRAAMGGTPTIADIIERGMHQAQGVIALFTEDEFAALRPQFRSTLDRPDEVVRWQARPNVIFEAGMAFGRDRNRVVFVLLGNPALFSDVAGVHVLRPTNDPTGDRKVLWDTLRKGLGCLVEDSTSWVDAGDFEACVRHLAPAIAGDPFAATGTSPALGAIVATLGENPSRQWHTLYDPRVHSEVVLGISFGATNACVAVFESNEAVVATDRGGYRTMPAVVAIRPTGKRLVGRAARREAIPNAENTAYGLTRLVGRNWGSPQTENARSVASYSVVEGTNGEPVVQFGTERFSIQQLMSFVIIELKEMAYTFTGKKPTKAVIAIPAYFNAQQRAATGEALRLADLEAISVITEPSAICLAYDLADETVAVFHLAGGTFDFSLIKTTDPGNFKLLYTTGDSYLGGEEFDARIVDWLCEKFLDEHDVDLRKDRLALQRLRDAAERAKCELSTATETDVELPFISLVGMQAYHLHYELTRSAFEKLTRDLVERSIEICQTALEDTCMNVANIDRVVLAGGMTRMPLVQERVQMFFKRRLTKELEPDQVVAIGAALQAGAVSGNYVTDSDAPLHYDVIAVVRGDSRVPIPIFATGTSLSASRTCAFTTTKDEQSKLHVLVLWREQAEGRSHALAEIVIKGLPSAPKGSINVNLTFQIGTDGAIKVRAADGHEKAFQSITVASLSDITDGDERSIRLEYGFSD